MVLSFSDYHHATLVEGWVYHKTHSPHTWIVRNGKLIDPHPDIGFDALYFSGIEIGGRAEIIDWLDKFPIVRNKPFYNRYGSDGQRFEPMKSAFEACWYHGYKSNPKHHKPLVDFSFDYPTDQP